MATKKTIRRRGPARKNHHNEPIHPGKLLMDQFAVPLEINQDALAKMLHVSYPTVHNLIHEKGRVTPNLALRLERAFGIDAITWMHIQTNHDLHKELQSKGAKKLSAIKRVL